MTHFTPPHLTPFTKIFTETSFSNEFSQPHWQESYHGHCFASQSRFDAYALLLSIATSEKRLVQEDVSMAVNDTIESVLKCVICTDELRQPKTLPCSHSFCKRCLAMLVTSKYVKKDGSLQAPSMTTCVVCPTCSASSQEFRSLDDIGTLHIINQLLEAQVKDRGEVLMESVCSICKKNNAKICCYRLVSFLVYVLGPLKNIRLSSCARQ